MPAISCDVAVVGLGAMGSAALWQLSRRGVVACGIDQHSPPHAHGSSHGQVRAIRKAYFEHPDYVPLLHRAYEGWRDLEDEAGVPLLSLCGMLFAGAPGGRAMQGLERCYAAHVLPHERWSAAEAETHFPQFRLDPDHGVFWDPLGGYVRAEDTIAHCLRLARQQGATTLLNEALTSWSASSRGCEIRTGGGYVVRAQSLIITAGPWTAPLLHALDVPLTILRKVQLWYDGPGIDTFAENTPVWYLDTPYGGIYGFPALGGFMKVAEHTGGREVDSPEGADRDLHEGDEQNVLRCLTETFPRWAPRRARHEVCLYTMTPDHHFILDRHPAHENVFIGAGFSGHGFKFAPVVGEVLADFVTIGITTHAVGFLALARFH
jgi:sarcosine oxidase